MIGAYSLLSLSFYSLMVLQYVIPSSAIHASSRAIAEILHFLCLGVATGVFYFIWDVDE
jgi:hypothetical protein